MEEYGGDYTRERWARLRRVTEEMADAIYERIYNRPDIYDIIAEKQDESEEARKKESQEFLHEAHLEMCQRMAKRLGIRKSVVISLRGEYEAVKKFLDTLQGFLYM